MCVLQSQNEIAFRSCLWAEVTTDATQLLGKHIHVKVTKHVITTTHVINQHSMSVNDSLRTAAWYQLPASTLGTIMRVIIMNSAKALDKLIIRQRTNAINTESRHAFTQHGITTVPHGEWFGQNGHQMFCQIASVLVCQWLTHQPMTPERLVMLPANKFVSNQKFTSMIALEQPENASLTFDCNWLNLQTICNNCFHTCLNVTGM
jgi:hypothetical protein